VKRYSMCPVGRGGVILDELQEDDDGDWVTHEDVAPKLAELERWRPLIAAAKAAQGRLLPSMVDPDIRYLRLKDERAITAAIVAAGEG
jgi:hypothetical protein